jgi:hypothetical protein
VQEVEPDRLTRQATPDLRIEPDGRGDSASGTPATPIAPVHDDDGTLEGLLAATQQAADVALKAAAGLTRELRNASGRARTGQLRELRRALASARSVAASLVEQTQALNDRFDLDDQAYLSSGAYAKELLATAESRGVTIFEEGDRLLCYPSLLRVLPGEAAVEIDKVRERRIRPSALVDLLAAAQQRAPRFKAEAFLDSLRAGYELVVSGEQTKADGVVRLLDVWSVLTMLPGLRAQYSKQEFARDLYLLDQSGVISTARSPRELRWSASTGTKGAGVLVTVARSGQRQYYWGVSFTLDSERPTPGAEALAGTQGAV